MNNFSPFKLFYRFFTTSTRSASMHQSPAAKLARPPPAGISINTPRDPNTLSNYNNFRTKHVTANLEIDFERKRLMGNVVLRMKSCTHGESGKVVLDSRYARCVFLSWLSRQR